MFQLRWEAPVSDEHNEQRLPPIAESNTAAPRRSDPEVGLLHQQALFLPLLFPGKEGNKDTHRGSAVIH